MRVLSLSAARALFVSSRVESRLRLESAYPGVVHYSDRSEYTHNGSTYVYTYYRPDLDSTVTIVK